MGDAGSRYLLRCSSFFPQSELAPRTATRMRPYDDTGLRLCPRRPPHVEARDLLFQIRLSLR